MGMFTRIASDAFDALQVDAGVILTNFDPYNPWVIPSDDDILMTTTGGISINESATTVDYAADVDNATDNMMEFKRITSRTASISCQSIKFNAANAKWALGAADQSMLPNGVRRVAPRKDLKLSDFKDIWWVGDKANGGAYAIHVLNALSTGGLNIQTNKGGKGTNSVTIEGHVSLAEQDKMPLEVYDIPPMDVAAEAKITYRLTHATSTEDAETIEVGEAYTTTLTATSPYVMKSVHILMGETDITADVYSAGSVSIAAVTDDLEIVATAATQYSITNTLTHVSTSNANTTIFENDGYTAILTPDTDYTMDSVTVTMGGDDVTDTVYTAATRTINIAKATGDIVVSATAEE